MTRPPLPWRLPSLDMLSRKVARALPLPAALVPTAAAITRRLRIRGTYYIAKALHDFEHTTHPIRAIAPVTGTRLRMHVDTASFIDWHVYFLGAYEREVSELLCRYLHPGHVAIDVGANVGVHTLRMAVAAPDAQVIAFEPNPAVAIRLAENARLNRLANISIVEVALSDRERDATLYVSTTFNQGESSLTRTEGLQYRPVPVRTATLDAAVQNITRGPVDLIKIDVEGHEEPILRGATRILREHRPLIVFEYNRRCWQEAGYSLANALAFLREQGYTRFHLLDRHHGLQPLRGPTYPGGNIVAW